MLGMPFSGLLNNVALLLSLVLVYGTVPKSADFRGLKIIQGSLFGVIACGLMSTPWELVPGVIFDSRTVLLSVGGMFFGAIPTLLAMAIAATYRLYLGGGGAFTGVLTILFSGLAGLAWRKLRKPAYQLSSLEWYLFGFCIQSIVLLLMLTIPASLIVPVLKNITIPTLAIYPLVTVLLAKLLANQEAQARHKATLDASERKYRELVQHSRVILLSIDTEGKITYISEFAEDFFGFQANELIGKSMVGTIVPEVDSEGQPLGQRLMTFLKQPGELLESENENLCRDGRRVRIQWKNTPLYNAAGQYVGLQCIGHDVTKLRQAEAVLKAREIQLRRLVEMAPMPLAITEKGLRIAYLNRQFVQTFGYTLEDIPTVEDWWSNAYPDEHYRETLKTLWQKEIARVLEEQAEFVPQEVQVTCKDGTIRDTVIRFSSIGEKEIVVFNDVTRERDLDRMKSEFIATAAHELNTPLSTVRGFAELLLMEKDLDEEQQREYLTIINDKTETLEKIIDELLDISRIESGRRVHLERQPCDIRQLVVSSVNAYRKELSDRIFDLDWQGAGPETLQADPWKLKQVMENLLSNAVKFSPPASPIRVRGIAVETGVTIEVEDKGIGMTAEHLSRIFDKFYRVDSSDTAVPGLGLGMAIAKGIVEAHGGSITAHSTLGEGTIVSFTLPRHPQQ